MSIFPKKIYINMKQTHMKRNSLVIREIQIETIRRCYLTLTKMVIMKKSDSKCW
jgi:hypothetical protein